MENIDWISIFIDLIITFVLYESVPLVLKYLFNKEYTPKDARHIAIINAIIVYIILTIYLILIGQNRIANITPALLWGYIGYYILKSKTNVTNHKEDYKNDEELETLINNLEQEKDNK